MGTEASEAFDLTGRDPAEDRCGDGEADLFEHLFRTTAEGLAIVGHRDGLFLEVNEAFLRLLGLERADVIGSSSFELGLWADLGGEGTARAVLSERTWVEDLLAQFGRI